MTASTAHAARFGILLQLFLTFASFFSDYTYENMHVVTCSYPLPRLEQTHAYCSSFFR
jgi:hypothetical protein